MIRRSRQIDKDGVRRRSVFGRRALMLGGVQAAGIGALGYRYFTLQVTQHDQHKAVATDNRLRREILEPKRGQLYDRFGEKLAVNESGFQVLFRPQNDGEDALVLFKLFGILRMSDAEVNAFTQRLVASAGRGAIPVMDSIDRDTAVAVDSEAVNLPGVSVVERDTRRYPFGALTAHVVGYVRNADPDDVARDNDPLLRIPGFKIGQVGVEATMDRTLRGVAGFKENEIDAHGTRLREVQRSLPSRGLDLELTIDVGLHQSIYQRLENDPRVNEAAVVVMNVHTGEVLASVSYPSYDPNGYIGRVDPTWYRSVSQNPYTPQLNRVMRGRYAPASTYKMLPLLAALEKGSITPNHRVTCNGRIVVQTGGGVSSRDFRCWKRSGHGTQTMTTALKNSCDVYMYELVEGEDKRIDHEETLDMARRFGLGQAVCMDLVGEDTGLLPTDETKLERVGDRLRTGDRINASIGQGYWGTTPLQLATMTARLVNGGYAVQPYYVQPDVPYAWPQMNLATRNLNHIRQAMEAVVLDERGTAYKARIKIGGLEMAGKTGTAQITGLAAGDAEAPECDLAEYDKRDNSLFVGYAPYQNPRYACSVVVEHGCGGSSTAAPIARDILTVAQQRNSSQMRADIPQRPTMREITEERRRAEAAMVARQEADAAAFAAEAQAARQLDAIGPQDLGQEG